MNIVLSVTLAAMACVATQSALAQSYPVRTITLVVPFAPGGPTDSSARLIGRSLSTRLKQPVVIENRPGAGGTTGSAYVARAKADGYTLLWASTSSVGVAPALYPKLSYSPLTSFSPLAMIARSPIVLTARGNIKAESLKEFIDLAKTQQLSYGSAGNGSITHLVAEWFNDEAKINTMHVPYKGGAPALNDLLGGQVDMTLETIPTVSSFIKTNRVKVLATTGKTRAPQLPNVPTVREVIGGDFEAYSWVGLVAPAGTPADVLKVLSDALQASENDSALQREIEATGLDPVKSSPEAFKRDIEAELAKWTRLVKKVNPVVE
ncbi:Bug family tripartite tricarboxylate transporter substrate binding protein [Herbaspirillum sp. GCM10030257]|uniref:Bug family tripartite tricarboxylate transporter substrate binding protein n=1 Tax=Herbaspirillum sp. GCM10030257 TaxID=3273393 RepID=UPI0036124AE2